MFRREGRRILSDSPMNAVAPFIMPDRIGASNSFSSSFDISKCEELIRKKRAEGLKGIGMMHLFMAAYVRVVSQLPGINRYIRGQRVYARNSIEICMVIKKSLTLNSAETIIKIFPEHTDTLDAVYEQLSSEVEKNKEITEQSKLDNLIRLLFKIPRLFLKFIVWILKTFDYYGLLPRSLTRLSPFHGSLFITNLGSLGIPPVSHHIYNFGNIPLFIALGAKRTVYNLNKDGEVEKQRLIDFTIMCDDRICDGHYYATAFKKLKKLLEDPEQLLTPPACVVEDIR